ncbi:MAG: T9SS type A sorting domain-containing protein [Saprospirales bacterium]|nr:T9SS type A sorting domain-containing protein [Saprospirales bacterium]
MGANTAMLQLMKNNRDTLGITATEAAYDETIARTMTMLQQKSLETSLEFVESRNDTAFFSLWLTNKAGHKFPSGYPSRRAFVEFLVTNETGDTLFHSGKLDGNWEVEGLDTPFEPHYTAIDQSGQVQVYETVIADVTGATTTVLERAAITLKDNRLPPQGFSTGHAAYDTAQIVGVAASDPDFNWKDGLEGSGADRIFYQIPLGGYVGNLNVEMRVHYQSLPPRWMTPILAENTPEIDLFRDLFDVSDKSTVVVAEQSLEDVYVVGGTATRQQQLPAHLIRIFPNPTSNGQLQLQVEAGVKIRAIRLYDVHGRQVWIAKGKLEWIPLPGAGVFFVEVQTQKGLWAEKVIGY